MHVFFQKTLSQNPCLVQHLLCDRSAVPLGPHSSHNTPRECPEAFPEVYDHHRGWGAVNPPGRKPNIWPDLRIRRSKSQIWSNVRLFPGGFPASPPPVVDLHSWKSLRAIPKAGMGAMRDKRGRRTSSQKMVGQNVISEIVFRKKTCKFWGFQNLDFVI